MPSGALLPLLALLPCQRTETSHHIGMTTRHGERGSTTSPYLCADRTGSRECLTGRKKGGDVGDVPVFLCALNYRARAAAPGTRADEEAATAAAAAWQRRWQQKGGFPAIQVQVQLKRD